MTSYQTSAIASSDEEDEYIPFSVGIIVTSSEPIEPETYLSTFDSSSHPLLDKSLWSFPIIYARCHVKSTPREYDPESLHSLVSTSHELIERGAAVIVTDTGFSSMQRDLAAQLPVPILCSAMIQVSSLKLVSNGEVGIVTLDRQLVGSWNLVAIGASPETPVIGLASDSLWRRESEYNSLSAIGPDNNSRLLSDLVRACEELIHHQNVSSIVLEEPRFAKYTKKIQERLSSVRIFDVVTAVNWLYGGLRQAGYHSINQQNNRMKDPGAGFTHAGTAPIFTRRYSRERVEDASIIADSATPIISGLSEVRISR